MPEARGTPGEHGNLHWFVLRLILAWMRCAVLVLGLFGGCAASPAVLPDEPLIAESEGVEGAAPPSVAAPERPLVVMPPGTIARADYDRVLADAPGRFFARLDAEPVVAAGKFRGWRVRSLFDGDPRFSGAIIHAGDVVTAINGKKLERPEQFFEAWEAARGRADLTVDLLRDGARQTLRWRIVDAVN